MKKVLLISRSIEAPWDEASRNLVRSLALNIDGYEFHVMTGKNGSSIKKDNVIDEKVYTKRPLDLSQKARLAMALLSMRKAFDVYHFCFVPEKLVSFYIRNVIPSGKLKVQTIPYVPDGVLDDPRKIMFGDIITVFSHATKEMLLSAGAKDIRVIYPSVDLEVFSPEETKGDMVRMLYAGYLSDRKVAWDMAAIVERTLSAKDNIAFTLAIRARDKREADMKREMGVMLSAKFPGRFSFVENARDFIPMMKSCDMLIYPFLDKFERKIDIPFVIAEAMASAKAVLVSDVAPLNEPFSHGGGILTGARTAEDFADEILKFSSDRELLKRTGLENRKVALSLFDSKKNSSKIKEIYLAHG